MEGIQRSKYGPILENRAKALSQAEKENTAWHEGCHAVVSEELGQDVTMITILPRGRSGGMVEARMGAENEMSYSDQQMLDRICMTMAGRVGTEMFINGRKDTGTRMDFFQANKMAREMIIDLGMSALGHLSSGRNPMTPGSQQAALPFGPTLLDEIDVTARAIVAEQYKRAQEIVARYKSFIEQKLQPVLMHDETILRPQWVQMWDKRNESVQPAASSEVL